MKYRADLADFLKRRSESTGGIAFYVTVPGHAECRFMTVFDANIYAARLRREGMTPTIEARPA